MALQPLHRGVAQADVAQLETGNVVYRLYAYSSITGVRARCYTIGEQGQEVLLFDHAVATAATNHELESVRCVHVNDVYFVVYWLDRDTVGASYTLEASWLDITDIDATQTWTSMSTITPDNAGLYDVKQIYNATGTSEYILGWATTTTQIIVRRVTGPDHTFTPWSTTITSNHADRILAVHGDGIAGSNDGGVAVLFQGTGGFANQLRISTLDYSDGTDVSGADGDLAYSGSTCDFGAAGMALCQPTAASTTPRVAIVAEFQNLDLGITTEEDLAHHIVMREFRINASPSGLGNAHEIPNLNMMSKPYSYLDAEGDRHVYCGLAFQTVDSDNNWGQNKAFICDMGLQHWGDTGDTVRPRPVASFPMGNMDTAAHKDAPESSAQVGSATDGQRRTNHLSNWVQGPSWLSYDRKSRTVVWPGWAQLGSRVLPLGGELGRTVPEPLGATLRKVTHVLEDPWTVNRDPLDHPQPTQTFHGSNHTSLWDTTESKGNLLIAGGTPHFYDGEQVYEAGFMWSPEITNVIATGAGGTLSAGEYRYTAVYEWRDNRGVLHRSGFATPKSVTAVLNDSVNLTVRTHTVGSKDASWLYPNAEDIVIAIYRTTVTNPNKFRRLFTSETALFTPADIPKNDPTTWALTSPADFPTDTRPDWEVNLAPLLSFADGDPAQTELQPFTPPAAHAVATWRNRAWLASSENPKELWYSKEIVGSAINGPTAPEWNPAFVFSMDEVRGPVTALQPMDDSLVVFTRDGIYALTGDGFDALASAGSSSLTLQVVHELTGCIEPRSVALTPAGIVFQSYKGMYLLDKGFGLDFISTGAAVEDIVRTAGNVRSGENLDDRHTVAFVANDAVTDGPIVLKYDYYHRMWSTSDIEPPNSTTWLSSTASGTSWRANERDLSHVVLCQGNLLVERGKDDATPYEDEDDTNASEPVRIDVETGWIPIAGIMGYKRLYEIAVQTDGGSDRLYGELDVDDTGSFTLGSHEDHRALIASAVPGHLKIRPATQKMAAFRLRLYEPTGITAGDFRLVGISAKIGVKKGLRRVADSQEGTATGT